jgi:hypothetical protein
MPLGLLSSGLDVLYFARLRVRWAAASLVAAVWTDDRRWAATAGLLAVFRVLHGANRMDCGVSALACGYDALIFPYLLPPEVKGPRFGDSGGDQAGKAQAGTGVRHSSDVAGRGADRGTHRRAENRGRRVSADRAAGRGR